MSANKITVRNCFHPSHYKYLKKLLIYKLSRIQGNSHFPTLLEGKQIPDSSVGKESTCNAEDPGLIPGLGRSIGVRDRLPTPVFLGFSCGWAGKEPVCNVGDLGSVPGEGKSYPLQYFDLENSMECVVHGVSKSQTWLSDFHFYW